MLKFIIEAVIIADPKRPKDLEGKTIEEIRRDRDTAMLNGIFSVVSVDFIHNHIDSLPQHKFYSAAFASDMLEEFLQRSSTRFHDGAIRPLLDKVSRYLKQTLAVDQFYGELGTTTGVQNLHHNHNPLFAKQRTSQLQAQERARRKLATALSNLISYVHENYVSINKDDLSKIAKNRFRSATGYRR